MIEWHRKVIADAADQPDATYKSLATWAGVSTKTLTRHRKQYPEFDQAINEARKGLCTSDAVGIEEFCLSPDYLGLEGKVWPVVMEELKEINSGQYDLALLLGSIAAGKTYAATLSLLYELYQLLLIDDPHGYYDLDDASPIILAVQNKSKKLAERNDYTLARRLIERSPWFQKYAPHNPRLTSRIVFTRKNVEVWAASGDPEDILGMNLYAVILDEANFFARVEKSKRSVHGGAFDGAREAFENSLRRKQSRFPDGSGMFFVVSSKRFKGQITDELTKEFKDDETTYIYDHNQWSIRPELYRDGDWFNVFIGDRLRVARILDDDEEVAPADRHLIRKIPDRFRRAFERDIVRSLQDIAGISTEVSGAFFQDKEALGRAACLEQVFIGNSDATGNATHLLPDIAPNGIPDPQSPRIVHADLSLTGDLTGIAIGHIHSFTDRGLPIIHVDGVGRVHPPRNGQIEIDSVYRLVEQWHLAGIPIQWFSCDGYQSADILQRVRRLGIAADKISVDRTSPTDPMKAYETLRNAISEGRFMFPDDGETVEDMLWLQVDHDKQKVDHLPHKKKDTADCLAAIAYHLTHEVPIWQLVDRVDGAIRAATVTQRQLGGQVTSIPPPRLSAMDEIRIRRGMPQRSY